MSGEIKAGDLVCVVRGRTCCGLQDGLGWHFVVKHIAPAAGLPCTECGRSIADGQPLAYGRGPKQHGYAEVARLQKIDPPPVKQSVEHREELPA